MKGVKGRGLELYAVSNTEFKHILRFLRPLRADPLELLSQSANDNADCRFPVANGWSGEVLTHQDTIEGDQVVTSRYMNGVMPPPFWKLVLRGNNLAEAASA